MTHKKPRPPSPPDKMVATVGHAATLRALIGTVAALLVLTWITVAV